MQTEPLGQRFRYRGAEVHPSCASNILRFVEGVGGQRQRGSLLFYLYERTDWSHAHHYSIKPVINVYHPRLPVMDANRGKVKEYLVA